MTILRLLHVWTHLTFKVALGGNIIIAFLQIKNHHAKKLITSPSLHLSWESLGLNPDSLVPSFIMVINKTIILRNNIIGYFFFLFLFSY